LGESERVTNQHISKYQQTYLFVTMPFFKFMDRKSMKLLALIPLVTILAACESTSPSNESSASPETSSTPTYSGDLFVNQLSLKRFSLDDLEAETAYSDNLESWANGSLTDVSDLRSLSAVDFNENFQVATNALVPAIVDHKIDMIPNGISEDYSGKIFSSIGLPPTSSDSDKVFKIDIEFYAENIVDQCDHYMSLIYADEHSSGNWCVSSYEGSSFSTVIPASDDIRFVLKSNVDDSNTDFSFKISSISVTALDADEYWKQKDLSKLLLVKDENNDVLGLLNNTASDSANLWLQSSGQHALSWQRNHENQFNNYTSAAIQLSFNKAEWGVEGKLNNETINIREAYLYNGIGIDGDYINEYNNDEYNISITRNETRTIDGEEVYGNFLSINESEGALISYHEYGNYQSIIKAVIDNKEFSIIAKEDDSLLIIGDYLGDGQLISKLDFKPWDISSQLEGSWSSSSQSMESEGNPHYQLTISTAGDYRIDLVSTDVSDTYLYLLDQSGTFIVSDDDGGESVSARITRTLEAGSYQIVAATFSEEQSGSHTVTVTSKDSITSTLSLINQ
jgi:hypothetical protein